MRLETHFNHGLLLSLQADKPALKSPDSRTSNKPVTIVRGYALRICCAGKPPIPVRWPEKGTEHIKDPRLPQMNMSVVVAHLI